MRGVAFPRIRPIGGFQQRRASFSNTRRRRMSADQKQLEKLTLESVEGLIVVKDSFGQSRDSDDQKEESREVVEEKRHLEAGQPWPCDHCDRMVVYKHGFCTCSGCDAVYHVRSTGYSGPIALSDNTLACVNMGVYERDRVIESMLERHKGAVRMERMSVAALEKEKAKLAARLAGEVVAYVTNIRPRLTEGIQAEVMEMFLYVVIDQLDEYFVELE